jgi:glycosyltransferase involved in cell wall biosynthesis
MKLLTIGVATVNDYDGLYFTLQSIRLYHPETLPYIQFLVIDNGSSEETQAAIQELLDSIDDSAYIYYDEKQSTFVKSLIFEHAKTEWVMVLDSHVMLAPASLSVFLRFIENHHCNDLFHGPLLDDSLSVCATSFKLEWSEGMYGVWDLLEPLPHEEFPIEAMGMGCFACRREAWPKLNPMLSGFGGEEWYVHELFHRRGNQVVCLPFLKWLHRFDRPNGVPYPLSWDDRIRNYMIIHGELEIDPRPMLQHFCEYIGREETEKILKNVLTELIETGWGKAA